MLFVKRKSTIFFEADLSLPARTCHFLQAGRTRRSHPEDEGQVMTKGSEGRTTPAVAASERRKSLKLVRGERETRGRELLMSPVNMKQSPRVLSCRFFPSQDCLLGSARCVLLQCPLHSFSGQAVLKIHARLWNSSFIEVKKTSHQHLTAHYSPLLALASA